MGLINNGKSEKNLCSTGGAVTPIAYRLAHTHTLRFFLASMGKVGLPYPMSTLNPNKIIMQTIQSLYLAVVLSIFGVNLLALI